jgi:hypothetical protein
MTNKGIRAACSAFAETLRMRTGTWLVGKLTDLALRKGPAEPDLAEHLEELGTSAYVHPKPGAEEEAEP